MNEFYFFIVLSWLAGIRTDIARNAGQPVGYGRAAEVIFVLMAAFRLIRNILN